MVTYDSAVPPLFFPPRSRLAKTLDEVSTHVVITRSQTVDHSLTKGVDRCCKTKAYLIISPVSPRKRLKESL
ncbi:hypothetical protein SAMN02745126_04343 [Enhydrobacter aerosaccus]|uniref:Uncharacterized protein n=1 Tax=Enhydrobacter aerosaccus TaxID=225324 RepID=A0A1T4S6A9_9HYPH|nr:hypothetical protein SAMN02745126_04343 [Enhydrobacter aerosaccus]